jgi:hypothetical protein
MQFDALVGPATRRALSGEDSDPDGGSKAWRADVVARPSRRPMQKAVVPHTCVGVEFYEGCMLRFCTE